MPGAATSGAAAAVSPSVAVRRSVAVPTLVSVFTVVTADPPVGRAIEDLSYPCWRAMGWYAILEIRYCVPSQVTRSPWWVDAPGRGWMKPNNSNATSTLKPPVRERLIEAAFELFGERGYEVTTVEDIAERAGVGRTTFFRNFRSKDEVVFPDHEQLMEAIKARLATSTDSTALVAVAEAVRLVLLRYIEEGERARLRYALTSRVSALRDREIASVAQYQRLFREFIGAWMGPSEANALRAELMASSVAAAHNHVLRRWLRGDTVEPIEEVDRAMAQVVELFSAAAAGQGAVGTTVIVLRTSQRPDEILPAIRRALGGDPV